MSSKASGVYARTPQHDAQGSSESASEGDATPYNQESWTVPKDVMQAAEKALHASNNGLDTTRSDTVATNARELHFAERRQRGHAGAIEHAESRRYNATTA